MYDLQLVGVHDDGEHVVLSGADGQRYRLLIDEPLRAAVRRDRARLGQLQIEIDGGMRPRDIQARIRAGATAEDVATEAGLPVEHVRRYSGPVLAERRHITEQARRVPIRRRDSSGRSPELDVLVGERLTARGVPEGAEWDSWRRDDATWTVQVRFHAGSKERRAQWAFDALRSTIEPLDDEARWLSAVENTEAGPIPGRRLAAVREHVYDVEADGGVRESPGEVPPGRLALPGRPGAPSSQQPVLEPPGDDEDMLAGTTDDPGHDPAAEDATPGRGAADLLDALRGRRGRRSPASAGQQPDHPRTDATSLTDGSPGPVPAAHPPASRPEEAVDAEILQLPDEPEPVGPRPGAKGSAGRSRGKRPSVPSWDDIVFGSKRD